nr:3'(2'),5'-bisphosphate nucleotidase CysQ [uncultured Carboxylicivirga sp.]
MHKLTMMALRASVAGGQAIMKIYDKEDFQVMLKSDKSPLTEADINSHYAIDAILSTSDIPVLSEEGKDLTYEERKHWKQLWVVDPLDGTKEFVKRNDEFTVNVALVLDQKPIMGVIVAPALNLVYWGDQDGAYRSVLPKKWLKKDPMEVVTDLNPVKIPDIKTEEFAVVRSVSHFSAETKEYMDKLDATHVSIKSMSIGSSLKMCLVAEGKAQLYPRLGPTMEWDTCAGHAIVEAAGGQLLDWNTKAPMLYNRPELLNGWFMVTGAMIDPQQYWLEEEKDNNQK